MPLQISMPSPMNNSNRAGAYIDARTVTGRTLLAMDGALDFPSGSRFPSGGGRDQVVPERQKEVSDDDPHAVLRRVLTENGVESDVIERVCAALATDQPAPFVGMPERGGSMVGSPQRSAMDTAALSRLSPKKRRKVLAAWAADRMAFDSRKARDLAPSSADISAFHHRIGGSGAHIKILG
jgi:hypothetical protein